MATGENQGVWEVNMGKPRGGDWRERQPQIPLPINDPPPSDCMSAPPSAQEPFFLDRRRASNLRSSRTRLPGTLACSALFSLSRGPPQSLLASITPVLSRPSNFPLSGPSPTLYPRRPSTLLPGDPAGSVLF